MYCKYCGKKISDDSMFCEHCGSKLDNIAKENILKRDMCNAENDNMDKTALSTETIHKSKENSSIIANEIVGILKITGIVLVILAIYIIGFIVVHQKDITKYDYETHASYFGESCYDPSTITGNWKLHWEEHYYDLLYYELHKRSPVFVTEQITPEQFLKDAERLEKEWYEKKESIERLLKKQPNSKGNVIIFSELDLDAFRMQSRNPEVLKKEAKENAKRDIADWNATINNYRKSGYRQDLKSTSLYVTLISLLVTLGTSYLLKLAKWVSNNKKSKNI